MVAGCVLSLVGLGAIAVVTTRTVASAADPAAGEVTATATGAELQRHLERSGLICAEEDPGRSLRACYGVTDGYAEVRWLADRATLQQSYVYLDHSSARDSMAEPVVDAFRRTLGLSDLQSRELRDAISQVATQAAHERGRWVKLPDSMFEVDGLGEGGVEVIWRRYGASSAGRNPEQLVSDQKRAVATLDDLGWSCGSPEDDWISCEVEDEDDELHLAIDRGQVMVVEGFGIESAARALYALDHAGSATLTPLLEVPGRPAVRVADGWVVLHDGYGWMRVFSTWW